jgi:SAM-dependent methyltransferase
MRVVAIDVSPAMISVARQKARAAGCADRIEFHCAAIEDFVAAGAAAESFDGVLSNFGAVNCVRDLPALVTVVARGLSPGGRLLWVVMGRHVPWEWAWFLLRGRWRKAWRRLTSAGVEWRGLMLSYPTPSEMAQCLWPFFMVERVSPLGFALPPSYASAWLERSPRALTMLGRLERFGQNCQALAAVSDHYIVEATRVPMRAA